jgi:hypothetical protein
VRLHGAKTEIANTAFDFRTVCPWVLVGRQGRHPEDPARIVRGKSGDLVVHRGWVWCPWEWLDYRGSDFVPVHRREEIRASLVRIEHPARSEMRVRIDYVHDPS